MGVLAGVHIGHWTGEGTGVTVLVPPEGTVGSGEVRGGAPATREFALLDPSKMVERIDAVVLSGGSAFGLAASHGVVKVLSDRETGFPTPSGPVPIVVGMSLFDGVIGDAAPGPDHGTLAVHAALSDSQPLASGRIGAGTGATTSKWRGIQAPGGFGYAVREVDGTTVAAVAAVNAAGDVIDTAGKPLFATAPSGESELNTTLVVVITDARLSKLECFLLSQSAHDGFARAIDPVHTRFDGDAVVTLATGTTDAAFDTIRAVVPHVVAHAIRAAVI